MPPPVVLQACASYQLSDLQPALEAVLEPLGGLAEYVQAGQTVFLKPNLIAPAAPEQAATTHPAVLEALAKMVLDLGATPQIGDAPAWGGPRSISDSTGMADVCQRLGIEFLFLDQHTALRSARQSVSGHFHVDPRILAADVVINVPKLKAHQQLGFTGAMKNLYGCLGGREKAWHHFSRSKSDYEFARFLVTYQASLPITLHLVDAVFAMEGAGPRMGVPRQLGLLAAGTSAVELDTILASIIGVPETHRFMLTAADELGLGETDPSKIDVLGTPPAEFAVPDFVFPDLLGVCFSPVRLLRGWWRNRRLIRREARS